MTSSAKRIVPGAKQEPARADYLGPAEAVGRSGPDVDVRLDDGVLVRARFAMPIAYDAEPGDLLLVIGRGSAHYVIGVLSGHGRASLAFPGDVDLHARGELRLSSDTAVTMHGPEVDVVTKKLRITADTLVETLASAYRRVSGLFSHRAGESHTVVEGQSYSQAKNIVMLSEDTVTVNGKQIRLG